MKNKKYKMESFSRYFYGLNPRVENRNLINREDQICVFNNFRNEYDTLNNLQIEIKLISYEINKKRH